MKGTEKKGRRVTLSGRLRTLAGLRGFADADFQILIIRGSLSDGDEFFRQAAGGEAVNAQIDLLLFTGPESPAAGLATGGLTGSIEGAGLSVSWMSIAPRGNGLGRVVFSPGQEVKAEVVGLERGKNPESDDILILGDRYMDELVSSAMEAAYGKKVKPTGGNETAASRGAAADFQVDYWYPFGCRDCDDFLWNEVPEMERKSRRTVSVNERDTGIPVSSKPFCRS